MNKSLLTLAALLAATVMLAAGCGSDDSSSDSDTSAEAPTKAEYITQADAICAADQETITAATKNLPNDINDASVQDAISNDILPVYQEQLTNLRALTPPEGAEDETAAIYDSLEDALGQVEDDPAALASADTFADANEKADAFGLKVCGS